MACTVDFDLRGTGGVVRLAGTLTSGSAGEVQDRIMRWLASSPDIRVVAVDLESVEFMDSAGLGVLLAALRAVNDRGGGLTLVRPGRKVRMLLDMTRLHKVLDVCETVDAALADVRERK